MSEQKLLPCPFCNTQLDNNDGDTIYPSGSGWCVDNDGIKSYLKMYQVPEEQWCYSVNCRCGAEMHGDSRDDAITIWNTRAQPSSKATDEHVPPVIQFLLGKSTLDGCEYGDGTKPETEQGYFWWRKQLRELFSDRAQVECERCKERGNIIEHNAKVFRESAEVLQAKVRDLEQQLSAQVESTDEQVEVISDVINHGVGITQNGKRIAPEDFYNLDRDENLCEALANAESALKQSAQVESAWRPISGKLPIQPLILDKHGRQRFEANPLVEHLLTDGPFDMNHLCIWCNENNIDDKYQEQFAQLIGYSLSGFETLSYVSDETYERACAIAPLKTDPLPASPTSEGG